MNVCERSEMLRDFAFDELNGADRVAVQRHVKSCDACEADLRAIQLTMATLRSVPNREVPQRIAFVSDKLFEPSPLARYFRGFFGSPSQVGFAAACLLAGAIFFSPARKPAEVRTVISTASGVDVSAQIDAAVKKAVARVHEEDMQLTQAALASAEVKHEQEHKVLMANMQETVEVIQKRMGVYTSELASLETPRVGAGQ